MVVVANLRMTAFAVSVPLTVVSKCLPCLDLFVYLFIFVISLESSVVVVLLLLLHKESSVAGELFCALVKQHPSYEGSHTSLSD